MTIDFSRKTQENAMVKDIIRRAKEDGKGDYLTYNMYKRELEKLALSPKKYTQACRKIASALRI